jgi:hypothetical protein
MIQYHKVVSLINAMKDDLKWDVYHAMKHLVTMKPLGVVFEQDNT